MPVPISTLLGATKLTVDSISGVIQAVEQMHGTISRHPAPFSSQPPEPIRAPGSAGHVYAALQAIIQTIGQVMDRSAVALLDRFPAHTPSATELSLLATFNGICGDFLESSGNPLALPMSFTTPHRILSPSPVEIRRMLPDATPHLVVLVHGLCLSDHSWSRRNRPCIGQRLREAHGSTPVYVRYNTGRRISTNGRELAASLSRLVRAWPVPVESLALIGHSMGGLVIRSACFYGENESQPWLDPLHRIVFLGTPHHGAPLEKLGHRLTAWMRRSPYVHPLALGARRSAGIKDLRHGNLLDDDWQGRNSDDPHPDERRVVPLMRDIEHHFVAGTVGHSANDVRGQLLGDLLVCLNSAVGAHPDALRRLHVQPENCRVFHGLNHFDLLDHPAVHAQLVEWFGSRGSAAPD